MKPGVTVLCILCCILTLAACQWAGKDPAYSITDPYQFPVVPGTEEWANYQSLQEMAEACQIPEDILSKMSTEALVETIANYPLWINVLAYEDRQLGLSHVMGYFNGLQELCTRDDAIEEVEGYIADRLQYSEEDPDSQEKSLKKFKTWYFEAILEDLRSESDR